MLCRWLLEKISTTHEWWVVESRQREGPYVGLGQEEMLMMSVPIHTSNSSSIRVHCWTAMLLALLMRIFNLAAFACKCRCTPFDVPYRVELDFEKLTTTRSTCVSQDVLHHQSLRVVWYTFAPVVLMALSVSLPIPDEDPVIKTALSVYSPAKLSSRTILECGGTVVVGTIVVSECVNFSPSLEVGHDVSSASVYHAVSRIWSKGCYKTTRLYRILIIGRKRVIGNKCRMDRWISADKVQYQRHLLLTPIPICYMRMTSSLRGASTTSKGMAQCT